MRYLGLEGLRYSRNGRMHMKSIQYRSVDEIAEVLQDMKSRGRSCSLLIGAGVSIAAGVPAAAGFVDLIKQRNPLAYARASEKTYPKCMAELLLNQRRNLIAEFVDKAKINWAHIGIGLLMQAGYIDRVLTTNFDPLVVRACAMLGVFPAVYDFATSQLLKNADIPDLAVFYLHGQRTGFVLMNTVEDMEAHSALLGPVFEGAGSGRTWIVVGYSGENDPVFEHLARQQRFDNGLFWVGYGDREAQAHVREKLLACDKDAYFTKGHDADSFFVSLARALQVFPPDLVARPFTYARRTLEQLTPFLQPGQTDYEDVLHAPNKWIQSAIDQFEVPAWDLITRGRGLQSEVTNLPVVLNAAQYLSMKGDYERVVALRSEHEKSPDSGLADLVSKAYVMLGNQMLDRAKLESFDNAKALFEQAKEHYQAALQVQPSRHEAVHNWANFLLDMAKASPSAELARQYFRDAGARYLEAHSMKPDQPEILINWGNLLLDRAKAALAGDVAADLFAQAEEKYRAALRIDPGLASVRYSLGNLLLDQAKMRSGPEADALFDAAEKQYKQATALNPEMAEAFYQWGNVFLDRAKRSIGGSPDVQFQAAIAQYQQALVVRPDMHQALNNWGSLLVDLGKSKQGAEADRLFEEARKRYNQATVMNPESYEAWSNWGNLLLDWRKRKQGALAEALFDEARQKYHKAHTLRPDMSEPLENWGNLFLDHAKTLSGDAADRWFDAAIEKYAAAAALQPKAHHVLNNWGNCLSDQGRRKSGEVAEKLFVQARKKYVTALALSQSANDVVQNYTRLLIDAGYCATREDALQIIKKESAADGHLTPPERPYQR